MLKIVAGFFGGVLFTAVMTWAFMGSLMFNETASPFGMEETVARIQGNVKATGNGWALSGLRNPARAVAADGGNVLPVMMVEACSTKYSKPILKDDATRMLSILMPCKISVYKKNDGKVYVGTMNAGLMGKMFGPTVAEVMGQVAEDQKKFLAFDPSKPAPAMITSTGGGEGAGGGGQGGGGGC
jgi:uncharacterized protein (DUF302 family)